METKLHKLLTIADIKQIISSYGQNCFGDRVYDPKDIVFLSVALYDRIEADIKNQVEVAEQYALTKVQELKSEEVSFHYATIEDEVREELKSKFSNMIYEAIPTGEVTAWELIKTLKQLKTEVEAL